MTDGEITSKLAIALRETLGYDEWWQLGQEEAEEEAARLLRRLHAKGLDIYPRLMATRPVYVFTPDGESWTE